MYVCVCVYWCVCVCVRMYVRVIPVGESAPVLVMWPNTFQNTLKIKTPHTPARTHRHIDAHTHTHTHTHTYTHTHTQTHKYRTYHSGGQKCARTDSVAFVPRAGCHNIGARYSHCGQVCVCVNILTPVM